MGIKEFVAMQKAELQTNSHFVATRTIQPKRKMKTAYLVFLVVAGISSVPQYRRIHIVVGIGSFDSLGTRKIREFFKCLLISWVLTGLFTSDYQA